MWVSPFTRNRETASIINNSLSIKRVKEDITLIKQQYGLFSDKEEVGRVLEKESDVRQLILKRKK